MYNNFFLSKLGRKLADQSGDYKEISFLFQRLSVLIQRYNAILLHDCFVKGGRSKVHSSLIFVLFCVAQRNFFIPWELSTGVQKITTIIVTKGQKLLN